MTSPYDSSDVRELVPIEEELHPFLRKYRACLLHICERIGFTSNNFTRDLQDLDLEADELLHKFIVSLAANLALWTGEDIGADSVVFSPFVRDDPQGNFLPRPDAAQDLSVREERGDTEASVSQALVSTELPVTTAQEVQDMQPVNGMQPGYMSSSGIQPLSSSAVWQGGQPVSFAQQQQSFEQQYQPAQQQQSFEQQYQSAAHQQYMPAVQQQMLQPVNVMLGFQGSMPLSTPAAHSLEQSQALHAQNMSSAYAPATMQNLSAQYVSAQQPQTMQSFAQSSMPAATWRVPTQSLQLQGPASMVSLSYPATQMLGYTDLLGAHPAFSTALNGQLLRAETSPRARVKTPLEQMTDITKAAETLQRADAYVSWKPGFLNILGHYPGLADRDKCSILKRVISQALQTHVSSDQAWIDGDSFPALFACLDRAFAPRTSQCMLELQNMRQDQGETCLQFLDRLHKLHLRHNVRFPQGKDEIQALVMRFNDQHRSNLRMELLVKSGERPGFAELRASCQEMDALNAASVSAAQSVSRPSRQRGGQINAADASPMHQQQAFVPHHDTGAFTGHRSNQPRGRGQYDNRRGQYRGRGRQGNSHAVGHNTVGCPDLGLNADRAPLCMADPHENLVANAHRTRRGRPNKPEPAQPNTGLPFPDNIRTQLRQQNFSFSNVGPMARLLDNNVHLTLRQLVAATNLEGWRDACKTIAELERDENGVDKFQDATEDAVRLVSIVQSALAEPIARAEGGDEPDLAPAIPASPAVTASIEPAERDLTWANAVTADPKVYPQYCVTMPTMQASLEPTGPPTCQLSLDSGAAFSCISETAFRRDKQALLKHGKLLKLHKPIRVSMYDNSISDSYEFVQGARLYIGDCFYNVDLVVVPDGSRDYLIGANFCKIYDASFQFSTCMCRIGCPPDGWRHRSKPYKKYQFCPISYHGKMMDLLYLPATPAASSPQN